MAVYTPSVISPIKQVKKSEAEALPLAPRKPIDAAQLVGLTAFAAPPPGDASAVLQPTAADASGAASGAAQQTALFTGMTPEQQQTFYTLAKNFATETLSANPPSAGAPSKTAQISTVTPQMSQSMQTAVGYYQGLHPKSDFDLSVQAVVYGGLNQLHNEIQEYAYQVKGRQDSKSRMRVDLHELNAQLAEWSDDEANKAQEVEWHQYDFISNSLVPHKAMLTKLQASSVREKLSDGITVLEDAATMDQVRLQKMAQDYQSSYTLMSGMLKMEFDTAKAIIGNIRA